MYKLPRLDKKVLSIESLDDADNEKTFWLSKNAQKRIAAIELNRRMVYGQDNTTSRLQRFLETSELACHNKSLHLTPTSMRNDYKKNIKK